MKNLKTLYISRPVLFSNIILDWCKKVGIPPTKYPLHVTVAYSSTPVDWNLPVFMPLYGGTTIDTTFELKYFGNSIVMIFDAPELQNRFKTLRSAGASYNFPEYNPNVTLSEASGIDIDNIRPYADLLYL